MKALALVLVLALPCMAQDAPTILEAGQPAPVKGLLMPEAVALQAAQKQVQLSAENESLKASVASAPSWVVVAVAVVVGLAGGVGIGYGVSRAVK